MEHTVVHKASTAAVDTVLERLFSRGIDAVAIDQPNFIALAMSFGTYRVRIAVPDEQVDRAKEILEEWDREAGPNVKQLSRQVQWQFFLAALGALAVAAVLFALGHVWLIMPGFLVVWLALVVLLGLRERAHSSRPPQDGGSDEGP